jgi:mono/diheme cytochrome c family protein
MRSPRRSFLSPRLAVLALVGVFIPSMLSAQAARVRTGKVADLYKENCASCHGDQMQGASAPSMLDDIWLNGGDDDSSRGASAMDSPIAVCPRGVR